MATALGRCDDVDSGPVAISGVVRARLHLDRGAVQRGPVELQPAVAAGTRPNAVERPVEDEQYPTRERAGRLETHLSALGERRRAGRVTVAPRVGGADRQHLEPCVLAEALVLDLVAGGGVRAPSEGDAERH